jgi:hypothetical protein
MKKTTAAHSLDPMDDPVLLMAGVGCHLWEHETGDDFVERLRKEHSPVAELVNPPAEDLTEAVWR